MNYNPHLKNQTVVGAHYKGECPFCHNESNKFYLNKFTGLWDCKNCQMAGNWFQFKKDLKDLLGITIEDVSDLDDIKKIKSNIKKVTTVLGTTTETEDDSEPSEIDLPEHLVPLSPKIKSAKEAWDYFVFERKFSHKLIEEHSLSYCKDGHYFNRIIIPVIMYRKLYGFLGRWVPTEGVESVSRKYKNSWDTKFAKLLWNYDNIERKEPLVICEGVFSGFRVGENVTATFGKKISKEQIQLLENKNVKEVVLLFDGDAKNEIVKYAGRLADSKMKVRLLLIPEGDPDDLCLKYENVIQEAEKFVYKKYVFFNLKEVV